MMYADWSHMVPVAHCTQIPFSARLCKVLQVKIESYCLGSTCRCSCNCDRVWIASQIIYYTTGIYRCNRYMLHNAGQPSYYIQGLVCDCEFENVSNGGGVSPWNWPFVAILHVVLTSDHSWVQYTHNPSVSLSCEPAHIEDHPRIEMDCLVGIDIGNPVTRFLFSYQCTARVESVYMTEVCPCKHC